VLDLGEREEICVRRPMCRESVHPRAAGVGKAKQLGDFVEGFARGVVDGLADVAIEPSIFERSLGEIEMRMASANDEREQWRSIGESRDGVHQDGVDVPLEMVDCDQRQFGPKGQPLGEGDSDEQSTGQPWAFGDGHGVEVGIAETGTLHGFAYDWHDRPKVFARREFWHDPAVVAMDELRGDHVREHLPTTTHDGGGGLVAGTFDTENESAGHEVYRTREWLTDSIEASMDRSNKANYRAALRIVRRLRALGHAAYFAGGCVRDLLLGVTPQDFDVATSATPDLVQAAFPRTESVGAHFGVVLVIDHLSKEHVATEVATFRHDGAYSDGRRPDAVKFSLDPREDVLRRDFTINGLLLNAVAFDAGDRVEDCILDFVGGRGDLHAQLVRAIGEPSVRFTEDKLRMLRAVRFAARLRFTIERRTMEAIGQHAETVGVVSAERVRDELTKILTEGGARRGLELLDESGLLAQVLPEIKRMQGVEQPPQYHPEGDVWTHTLMLLDQLKPGASPALAWGMLLHDVGKPATFTAPDPAKPGDRIRFNGHVDVGVAIARTILSRLRFSNEECEQILALIKHHMQFGDVMQMKQSTLKRFLRLPMFEEHLALHRADSLSSHGKLDLYEFSKRRFEEMGEEQIRPRLLLTGADLIAAGYKPGPQFRTMLDAAEDAQLEGVVSTRDDSLRWIKERFGEAL